MLLRPIVARLLLALACALALGACGGPYVFRGTTLDPPNPAPDFTLADQHGQPFRLSEQRGKIVLLYFGFTACPDLCPTTLADLAVVRDTMETNFLGAWRMLIALSPSLRRSASGRVVNVSSGLGSLAGMSDHAPAYSASKAAMNAVTRLFAAELAPDGVLVNSVCPGWLATDMGGPDAGPVGDGARRVLWGIDLPDDGPTGGFFRDGEPVAW